MSADKRKRKNDELNHTERMRESFAKLMYSLVLFLTLYFAVSPGELTKILNLLLEQFNFREDVYEFGRYAEGAETAAKFLLADAVDFIANGNEGTGFTGSLEAYNTTLAKPEVDEFIRQTFADLGFADAVANMNALVAQGDLNGAAQAYLNFFMSLPEDVRLAIETQSFQGPIPNNQLPAINAELLARLGNPLLQSQEWLLRWVNSAEAQMQIRIFLLMLITLVAAVSWRKRRMHARGQGQEQEEQVDTSRLQDEQPDADTDSLTSQSYDSQTEQSQQ